MPFHPMRLATSIVFSRVSLLSDDDDEMIGLFVVCLILSDGLRDHEREEKIIGLK